MRVPLVLPPSGAPVVNLVLPPSGAPVVNLVRGSTMLGVLPLTSNTEWKRRQSRRRGYGK